MGGAIPKQVGLSCVGKLADHELESELVNKVASTPFLPFQPPGPAWSSCPSFLMVPVSSKVK